MGLSLEKQLLTMAQIAKQLNLAESTARFYRDRFENDIPSVGEGRKKRYKPETIPGGGGIGPTISDSLKMTDKNSKFYSTSDYVFSGYVK